MGKNLIASIVLSLCLISCVLDRWYSESISYGRIKGETLTLSGDQLNSLYKTEFSELKLYSITSSGNIRYYFEGIDFIIENNQIRRTDSSLIPDFTGHQIIYNSEGKFTWNPEPNRNPELTIPYQIYADYQFNVESDRFIKPANFISRHLYEKLCQRKQVIIVTVGTSITFGAHTYQHYYNKSDSQSYPYLVAVALNKIYGVECQIINESTDGGGVNQIQDLTTILAINPDVVFIELGMNDHDGENPDIKYFYNSINNAVIKFKDNNIDVVLLGFFQQIESWEQERQEHTIAFNAVLSEIASLSDVYFCDIYNFFELIDKNKLYKDYTGDFMHHPTSFGHQLYYLNIMPFFIDKRIKESYLLAYIY
jgi:lysophospholipase L1-like esterase